MAGQKVIWTLSCSLPFYPAFEKSYFIVFNYNAGESDSSIWNGLGNQCRNLPYYQLFSQSRTPSFV